MSGNATPPLFSVVIPTHNRSRVLQRAMQSVLAQSFSDFELIVVDDGSTDETELTVASLPDSRIRYLRQANQGAARARNAGASVARGELLTFLDSDDEALPGWLEVYRESFTDGADIVCCGCEIVEGEGSRPPRVILPHDMGRVLGGQSGLFYHGGVFALRRPVFEAVGGYSDRCRASQHTELSFRLVPAALAHGWSIDNIMRPLIRHYPGSAGSIRENPEALLEGARFILERHDVLLKQDPRLHANYFAIAGVSAARLGRHQEARKYLWWSARAHPTRARAWVRAAAMGLAPQICAWAWRSRSANRSREVGAS